MQRRPGMPIGLALLGAALALGGCKDKPDFDERYDAAKAKISQAAGEIDAQITATDAPPPDAEPRP